MFQKHTGTSMLEWVVMALVAVGVIGTVAWKLASASTAQADTAEQSLKEIPTFGPPAQ